MSGRGLTVIVGHNYYQWFGGEDKVFESESRLLEENGHQVVKFTERNERISDRGKLRTAVGAVWSRSSATRIQSLIESTRPDVVHFHNTLPLISPSAYFPAGAAGIPVVQTLHNYRLFCAKGMFFRNEVICEACLCKAVPWPAVRHACYRDSAVESAVVTAMQVVHRLLKTWQHKVDRYIALTEFAKAKFVEGGLAANQISVKPNFTPDPGLQKETIARHGAVFASRLAVEKGLQTLFRAWEKLDVALEVVGDGPMMEPLEKLAVPGIHLAGSKPHAHVMEALKRAEFMVLPSICYEGFPITIVESFAVGTPVIASRLGSSAEIVENGVTGLHFTSGDAEDLAAKVRWAADHPEEMRQMGKNARKIYEEKYTPEVNYRQLMAIYEEAIEDSKGRRSAGASAQ